MKFGYTIVYVANVAETLTFYKEAFGFETRFLRESGMYGELDTDATALAFASHAMGDLNLSGRYRKVNPTESRGNTPYQRITERSHVVRPTALVGW